MSVSGTLQQGGAVNHADDSGHTPLSLAASKGHKELYQLLLKNGGNVNHANIAGDTPLMLAGSKRFKDVCQI